MNDVANGHEHHEDLSSSGSHSGLHGGTTESILFQGLDVTSVGAFVFACFCLAVIAFLLEMGRHFASNYESQMKIIYDEKMNLIASSFQNTYTSVHVDQNTEDRNSGYKDETKTDVTPDIASSMNDPELIVKTKFLSELRSWLVLGFLYSSSYLVATFIMLIAMTYNIYLILSLCFGVTAGKLFSLHLKYRIPRV